MWEEQGRWLAYVLFTHCPTQAQADSQYQPGGHSVHCWCPNWASPPVLPLEFDRYAVMVDTDARSSADDITPDQQANRDRLTLLSDEVYWRDHQVWLAKQGYMLRPRYRPDWTPSWKNTGRRWMHFEDGLKLKVQFAFTLLTLKRW